jgi:type I restriction-modification system DNA methylase subunit
MKRAIRRGLEKCGYNAQRLATDYQFDGLVMPFAGFAYAPWDARSACITVVDSDIETIKSGHVRSVGAPVVLHCQGERLVWYKQKAASVEHLEDIDSEEIESFFQKHEHDFSPQTIYEAKTRVGVPSEEQLTFVDIGLMPNLERDSGDHLARLVARAIDVLKGDLKRRGVHNPAARDMFKSVFWLLAAKILRDKRVEHFMRLRPRDADDVFRKVGRHYSESDVRPPGGKAWIPAIQAAADEIFQSSDLGNVTPEALADVYENALVPKSLRKELGIHSTPPYLIDYILGKLKPWIEEIPERDRYVFEPACGSGAFLVGAMRLLRELCTCTTGEGRHEYLKERLAGVELDPFALEVARLSLTLADIPHSNGWKLEQGDMFASDTLEERAAKARIVLANPPFERFKAAEKQFNSKSGRKPTTATKAMEVLSRIVPNLQMGAVLGIVLPIGALHGKDGKSTRKLLLERCEVLEICLLPKNAFTYSRHETAMLICRRTTENIRTLTNVHYNRVKAAEIDAFRRSHLVRHSETVPQQALGQAPDYTLQWRELESVWRYCSNYLRFGSLARVGEGFSFVARTRRAENAVRPGGKAGAGYVTAYLGGISETPIFGQPQGKLCRDGADVIGTRRSAATPGIPQVLLNHAHLGMPWLVRALLDSAGHAVSNNFMVVRPICRLPLEYFWAILNSPFANAFAYANRTSRHVLAGTVEKMPIPDASREEIDAVVQAAKVYLAVAKSSGVPMPSAPDETAVKDALLRMDAEVLRLYDLPPRLERQVLDIFSGKNRPGVGCRFDGYFPPDFNAWIPLHEYISDEYQKAASSEAIQRCKPIKSRDILAAIKETAHLFDED